MVDHLVVGDPQDPRKELAVIGIAAVVDHTNGFDESLLENIVRDIAILDHHVDVIADTAAVTLDQFGNGLLVPCEILLQQHLVTQYLYVHTLLLKLVSE